MTQPEFLLLLGVPDDMTGSVAAGKPFSLRGNSGLAAALTDSLREQKWPAQIKLLRPGPALSPGKARLLLNAVCEPVIHRRSLSLLARMELRTGLPTLNPSWVIAGTGRASISRRLGHQVGVQVPLCTVFRRDRETLAEHVTRLGHRYPVLIRPLGQHGSEGLLRIDDEKQAATETVPSTGHVTDWVDFKSTDGQYRKCRMFLAGDTMVRRHQWTFPDWNITVKARAHMQDRPELIEAEKRWLAQPIDLSPGTVESRILHQFRALQLDFGSMDYALMSNGDVLIFEINACIQITGALSPEDIAKWPHIQAGNVRVIEAMTDLIRKRAAPLRRAKSGA